jgi:hypothetical protein
MSASAAGGTVGDGTAGGFTPLSLEQAQALMSEALTGIDRDTLLAERAEAEAQLRAAEATLSVADSDPNGHTDDKQEREDSTQKPHNVEERGSPEPEFDVGALRAAAARARQADDELAAAASEASDGPVTESGGHLGAAESAFARAMEIREELPATWRRLVGALISATGMAIVIGALGWNVYWLLVPIALIAILTVDLRVAGKHLRETSAEAAQALATVGGTGSEGLEVVRLQRRSADGAEARLASARAERDAAYDLFEGLAPGRHPSEVDEIVAEWDAELAARAEAARAEADAGVRARAEAEATEAREQAEAQAQAQAQAEEMLAQAAVTESPEVEVTVGEPEAEVTVADDATTADAPEPAPVTASEWWFGTPEAPEAPAAAAAPVRALAERLSAEGREALARIQAQLDALDRVEHAKTSLEWHEANGSHENGQSGQAESDRPERA